MVWTWLGSGVRAVDVSRGRRVAASGAVDGRGRVVDTGWWTGVAVVGCGRRSLAGVVVAGRGQKSWAGVAVGGRARGLES